MTKSIEATGKTIDAAIDSGLAQLGMTRDEVSVEVLENPRSGFFGIGAVPARVLLSYEVIETKDEKVIQFITGLLRHMGSDAQPEIVSKSEKNIEVQLKGENLGMLIGRRGDTLDAIQHLTNYSVNRGEDKRVRVTVDAENYRAKREESLQRLAVKMAGKVVKYKKNITLEAMNAFERHVIHATLQDYEDVTTYSTGSEPNRRVVVAYSKYKSIPDKK